MPLKTLLSPVMNLFSFGGVWGLFFVEIMLCIMSYSYDCIDTPFFLTFSLSMTLHDIIDDYLRSSLRS